MLKEKRVVVTGIGVLTPIGIGKEEFWKALKEERSGVVRIDNIVNLEGIETKIGAPVKEFEPKEYIDEKSARRLGRASQLAIAGAKLALEDSGIELERENLGEIGVIIGTGIGNLEKLIENYDVLLSKGSRRVSPLFIPQFMPNALAGDLAIEFGFGGPNFGLVSACAASTHALGLAVDLIKNDYAKIVISGGSEAVLRERITIAGFDRMGALSRKNNEPQKACRPFDAKRDGFVVGEGAGIFILESLEHAQNRKAHIYAEIIGLGMSDDAYHVTAPDPEGKGATKAMEMALKRAGINPEDVDYINAHGTSTLLNDKIETLAIKKVFGEQAYKVPVSSTKSMIGHLLGAAGVVEAAATILALEQGVIHPTINLEYPDPECDLDYVPEGARETEVKIALSNSFAFGGHNACLVLRRI